MYLGDLCMALVSVDVHFIHRVGDIIVTSAMFGSDGTPIANELIYLSEFIYFVRMQQKGGTCFESEMVVALLKKRHSS